jgi:glycosyltransferase involved in cell wall biosynthesis
VYELKEIVEAEKLQGKVSFKLSFSEAEKVALLRQSLAVVYTPTNEHFGIVPVETMYSGKVMYQIIQFVLLNCSNTNLQTMYLIL